MRLGTRASVWFNAVLRGDNEPRSAGSNVQDGSVLHRHGLPLTIGPDCTIGHMAIPYGCTIGAGTLVGMGATDRAERGGDRGQRADRAGALVTEGKDPGDGWSPVGPAGWFATDAGRDRAAGRLGPAVPKPMPRGFGRSSRRLSGVRRRSAHGGHAERGAGLGEGGLELVPAGIEPAAQQGELHAIGAQPADRNPVSHAARDRPAARCGNRLGTQAARHARRAPRRARCRHRQAALHAEDREIDELGGGARHAGPLGFPRRPRSGREHRVGDLARPVEGLAGGIGRAEGEAVEAQFGERGEAVADQLELAEPAPSVSCSSSSPLPIAPIGLTQVIGEPGR